MHVLLIHQAFVTIGEAGGTRHMELARFLTGHGHTVTVITSPVSYLTGEAKHGAGTPTQAAPQSAMPKGKAPTEETIDGVRIHYAQTARGLHRGFVPRLMAFFSFMFSSLRLALSITDVDLVWGTSPNLFQAVSAWGAARLKRKKLLLEIRDLWPDFAVGMGELRNRFLIFVARALEKFLYRHADQIIVNSPGFIPHIERLSGKKARLVPNGADVAMFEPTDADAYRETDWRKGDGFVVMYTGAHGPANDLGTALDAAAILKKCEPRVRFVFVGSGKEKARLIETARERALTNVTFLPPVSKADMANLIAAADAGLAILKAIPEFKTTYPNKVFDFMAAGKPVFCQIDGVIREVLDRYQAGVYVEPGNSESLADAIRAMFGKRDELAAMGRNGRRAVMGEFSRERAARDFLKIIESINP